MGLLIRHYTWLSWAFLAFSLSAYYVTVIVLNALFCPDRTEPVPACGIVIPQVPPRPAAPLSRHIPTHGRLSDVTDKYNTYLDAQPRLAVTRPRLSRPAPRKLRRPCQELVRTAS